MKQINFSKWAVVMTFFLSSLSFAQVELKGRVINENDQPIPGAKITIEGTSSTVDANNEGVFVIKSQVNDGALAVTKKGFVMAKVKFAATNALLDLGTIVLIAQSTSIDEVVVTVKGIVDLEEDRKTPIASSTITAAQIQAKSGNSDLPELLKSTPSVQNLRGGGFGDGSMFLRGFDQTNTAFLLNGQPINGMEDGKMYWSNWSGILDVANGIQVQRGLGSSKLAISSVGGTTNILIRTVDSKKGGFVSSTAGNNSFLKANAYVSTGLNKKGWAFSAMLGHWQGNGYVNNTEGRGQTYYFSVGYKPSEKHIFNFLITGAPQWHAAAGTQKLSDYVANGIRYNSWTYQIDNKTYAGGRNFYHKPVLNFSWDWKMSNKSNLSTVVYASSGRGGFAQVMTSGTPATPTYARGSYNNHNWAGLISNYENKLTDNLTLNVGADARYYNGEHFRAATDFFTVDSVATSNPANGSFFVTDNFGGYNPWLAVLNPNNDHKQRIGRDYSEVITYVGAFGQLEYAKDKFSAFFQGALSNQSHQRTEYWTVATPTKAEKVANLGYNAKVGAAYQVATRSKVFVNAGYYTRQPFHDELYRNNTNSNALRNPQVANQEITGLEGGYQFTADKLKVNVNVYNTIWANRTLSSDNGENDPALAEYYQTLGVTQNHKGVEVEFFYVPTSRLRMKGFWSAGDWRFKGDATKRTYNDAGDEITTTPETLKLDGVKVGGAAQVTAGAGFDFRVYKGLTIDVNGNWFNALYSNVGASANTIALPHYETVDFGIAYKVMVNKTESFLVRFNVDNVTNKQFIESASTSIAATAATSNWNGVNVNNKVRFGYGRTWNLTLRYNF
jgi:iron complex outermembrane recepter protein